MLVLDALQNQPGQSATALARQFDADKKLVNAVLYDELRGRVRQDREYRWFPIEIKGSDTAQQDEQISASNDSRVGRIAAYFLDVLAHDDSYHASVFAESRYEPKYLELPSFPPPSVEDLPPEDGSKLRSQINRLVSQRQDPGSRTAPAVGYPVYAQHISARSGWQGYVLKPLFIFDVDDVEPGSLQLVDADFPIINRDVLSSLTGVRGSALMEELLSLTKDLGLTDPQQMPELDELFLRLQQIRPEWPWREQLEPDHTTADWPLSGVKEEGFFNRCILLHVERSPFTKGLEAELQALRKIPDRLVQDTALARLIGLSDAAVRSDSDSEPLIEVVPLNTEQHHAVQSAMRRSLTVITGPPGTGKSQVVSQIVVNAVWRNKRVLVASKNNKAVDVVEYRVNSFSTQPGIFRLGARELSQRLADYLSKLLSSNVDDEDRRALSSLTDEYGRQLDGLQHITQQRDELIRVRNEVDQLSRAVESARNNLGPELFAHSIDVDTDAVQAYLDQAIESVRKLRKDLEPWMTRLFWGLIKNGRLSQARSAVEQLRPYLSHIGKDERLPEVGESAAGVLHGLLQELLPRIDELQSAREYHAAVTRLVSLSPLETLAREESALQSELHRIAARLWSAWLELAPERVDGEARSLLNQYAAILKMLATQDANDSGMGRVYARYYQLSEQVSPHLSAWAVTSLSAKGRIPFQPGLFDLVVIDEASQCDIASALPLLYRAKRAAIIGDPNQLRHISAVSERLDRQLIVKHDLLEHPQLAYSVNSLYDLAAGASGNEGVIALRDHHRSHADIIQFSNETFYSGKLRVATRYDRLKRVGSEEPAVQWEHVRGGTVRPETGSANNRDEAERVVAQVARILSTPGFDGTIGVVTPFRGQANLITRLLNEQEIPGSRISGTELLVDTVHKFQGDERDVMIFSPVVSRNAADSALRFLELNKHLFNVAITRARSTLIVVGDRTLADTLEPTHVLRQFSQYVDSLEELAEPEPEPVLQATEEVEYPTVARPELVSDWERRFFGSLRRAGLKPIPQYPAEQYLLDLALFDGERKLAIEVDGERFHRDWDGELVVRDRLRTLRLIELGWDVMRFWVYQIRDHEEECVRQVAEWLQAE